MKYKTIVSADIKAFYKEVTRHIDEGWTPMMGPNSEEIHVNGTLTKIISQDMIKNDKNKD